MRVSLKHSTVSRGLLFKKTFYEVSCTVLFSHEEIQILRLRNLLKTKLMDRRPATAKVDDRDEKFELLVKDLINGKTDRFVLANPSAAKLYEETLLAALQQLKFWIGDNAELGDGVVVEF